MPLTAFSRSVLGLLAGHRTPESFVAGGSVINAAADSPRYSDDVDIFHDAQERVHSAALADSETLRQAGFAVDWTSSFPGFVRANIQRDDESLRLDWSVDSAFRFFPVEADPELGWRLHLADLATNKVLALAGRWEPRDFIDALYLHESYAHLGLLAWAAAGKDPGLTPWLILEQADRLNRLRPEAFLAVLHTDQFDYVAMKTRWQECVTAARVLIERLPPEEVGALYLNAEEKPADPRGNPVVRGHFATFSGAWPQLVEGSVPLPPPIQRLAEDQAKQRYLRV